MEDRRLSFKEIKRMVKKLSLKAPKEEKDPMVWALTKITMGKNNAF